MPTGTIQIRQCRWDQVAVGDTVCDHSFACQRWITVHKIEPHGEMIEVWTDPNNLSGGGLLRNPRNVVDVQVWI